jgi:hypothetical protein
LGGRTKFINLFLRTATYNFYLRRKYKLDRIEPLLELPFDSFAAKELRSEREGKALSRWKGVIHLTPKVNAEYQAVAAQVAARMSTCRVHLDMMYWRREKTRRLRGHRRFGPGFLPVRCGRQTALSAISLTSFPEPVPLRIGNKPSVREKRTAATLKIA